MASGIRVLIYNTCHTVNQETFPSLANGKWKIPILMCGSSDYRAAAQHSCTNTQPKLIPKKYLSSSKHSSASSLAEGARFEPAVREVHAGFQVRLPRVAQI